MVSLTLPYDEDSLSGILNEIKSEESFSIEINDAVSKTSSIGGRVFSVMPGRFFNSCSTVEVSFGINA